MLNYIENMATEVKQILEKLDVIESKLDYIEENMPDKEIFLTTEEKQLLEESHKNEKEGKLISSGDLRKRLEI